MAFPRNDLNRDDIFDSVITCTGFALGLQRIRLRLLVYNLAGCWCCRTSCSFNELLDFAAIIMQLTRQQQLARRRILPTLIHAPMIPLWVPWPANNILCW